MAIRNEIVDELLIDVNPKDFSSEGLLAQIKKAPAERTLNAELDQQPEREAAAASNGEPSERSQKNGKMPARESHEARTQLALQFGDRFEMHQ